MYNIPHGHYGKCVILRHVRHSDSFSLRESKQPPIYNHSEKKSERGFRLEGGFFLEGKMRGGKREGAGRKPGAGWKPKRPEALRDLAKSRVREVLTTAQDPVAVLIAIANDQEVDVSVRVQAASNAAPYIFPRLSAAVVATAPMGAKDDHAGLIERIMGKLAAKLPPPVTIEHAPAPEAAE